MSWFEDAADAAPTPPLPERRRSRRVLVAWLLVGGVLVGLLVAGAVSAVAHFVDEQNTSAPAEPGTHRPEPGLG